LGDESARKRVVPEAGSRAARKQGDRPRAARWEERRETRDHEPLCKG